MDLEDSAGNQADTIDTQDDTDIWQIITILPSGMVAAIGSQQSHNIKFLDTNTGEVVLCTDVKYEDDMNIAFVPDNKQAAILSKFLVTIYDIIDLEKCVSFNPWPRNDVQNSKVAFQTCNNLVICTIFGGSRSLQVWHRQDPAGFECTYSLGFRMYGRNSFPFLTSNGLTVVIEHLSFSSSATCYSWNHNTA